MVPFCLPLSRSLPFTSWESPDCRQLFEQQQAVVVNVHRASKWVETCVSVCWMLMKSRCWISDEPALVYACVKLHVWAYVCLCVCVYMFAPLPSPNRWVLLVSQHLIGQQLLINNMQAAWCCKPREFMVSWPSGYTGGDANRERVCQVSRAMEKSATLHLLIIHSGKSFHSY